MPYKLKPEYKKMLEIYPDFEEEVNINWEAEEEGKFILVRNSITGYADRLWTRPNMFDVDYKYKAKDRLISLLCSDEEFNEVFQRTCEAQWKDPTCYVRISYPLSDLAKERDNPSTILVYKGDIDRIVV